jgi:hypothetical protein
MFYLVLSVTFGAFPVIGVDLDLMELRLMEEGAPYFKQAFHGLGGAGASYIEYASSLWTFCCSCRK